jgi:hypothetical protein
MDGMSVEPLIVHRLGPEGWPVQELSSADDEMDDMRDAFGEQMEWGFAIPSIYRVLAPPSSGETLPRKPELGDPQWFSCGYWTALLHVLIYSVGWFRPDLGLSWWYQNGKPTDDPRLRLLGEVFDADGQLDWFAAWLWGVQFGRRMDWNLNELTGWIDSRQEPSVDRSWMECQYREATASGIHTPIGSGYDELHLTVHCHGPLESSWSSPSLLHTDPDQRRAVVVVDSLVGWYRSLCIAGMELPPLRDRSWHVDVFVKQTGWLGTFRRSWTTGLWFSGEHQFHEPAA